MNDVLLLWIKYSLTSTQSIIHIFIVDRAFLIEKKYNPSQKKSLCSVISDGNWACVRHSLTLHKIIKKYLNILEKHFLSLFNEERMIQRCWENVKLQTKTAKGGRWNWVCEMNMEVSQTCILFNSQQDSPLTKINLNSLIFMRNNPIFHLIYYIIQKFPNQFMLSVTALNHFLMQNDANLVNDGPI